MRIKIINVVRVDVFLHSFFPAFHYPLFHILSNTKQAFAWCYICWKAPSCCYATIKYIWGELLSSLLLPFSNLCTQCCRNCTFADVVSFALFPLCKQGPLVNTLYTVESEICDKTYLSDHICSRQHIDLSSGATETAPADQVGKNIQFLLQKQNSYNYISYAQLLPSLLLPFSCSQHVQSSLFDTWKLPAAQKLSNLPHMRSQH